MIDPIFSILYETGDKVIHTGTGFLVYQNGLFITTGHTFREKKKKNSNLSVNDFRALFFDSGKPVIFEFKELYFKSLELEDEYNKVNVQRGPEYYDIAIGKININNENYLILDRRKPKTQKRLEIKGLYSRNKKGNNYGKNFEQLVELDKITFNSIKMNLKQHEALITKNKEYYNKLQENDKKKHFFNNCMTLDRRLNDAHGASGCPVLDQGRVVGILIGAPGEEEQTHILSAKYCSKSIQHKSPYLYEPFEYLSVD